MKFKILFVTFFLSLTFILVKCNSSPSSTYEDEIKFVQQSPATYGMVYDVLLKLNANSTIEKMPSFSKLLPKIMKDVKWSAGKDERGDIFVNATGYMTYLGSYSEVHIQWIVKGNVKDGTGRPYFNGMLVDGRNPGKASFDTISVLMLYNEKVINGKQLAVLALYMSFNNALMNY